ncbi:hypothetical protein Hbl1158_03900 [Halobaculum sp. CBA1158]|uniref:hypothetical protein n=1 Tax=Halobaculum sp. CBA1158 TaxID=2904243 RepID=UPI001F2F64EF|nr:hypothetical protein [Halobaculum sp. CBA1158]UIP00515.1 hypothetical protein Hbl1158_03900 [Halobaculum sp. CBA1158]
MSRERSALLWGAVGLLVVLVGGQALVLLGSGLPFGFAALFALALVVGGVVAAASYGLEHRLTGKGQA